MITLRTGRTFPVILLALLALAMPACKNNSNPAGTKVKQPFSGGKYESNQSLLYYGVTYVNEETGMQMTVHSEINATDPNYTITITCSATDPEKAAQFAKDFPGEPNPYATQTVKLSGHVTPK